MSENNKHAQLWLDIKKIDQEKSVQTRGSTDSITVLEYVEAIKAGEVFPPVTVFRDGQQYFIADGWHRLKAHELAGKEKIQVHIVQGSYRDALFFAVGANAKHGKQRTLADKERAVLLLLNDPEWSKMSDSEILRTVKITDPAFVRKVRQKYGVEKSAVSIVRRGDKLLQVDLRNVGKNGETYADRLAKMPFDKKASPHIARVVKVLDKAILTGNRKKLSMESLFSMRKSLAAAAAEFENRRLVLKRRGKK